VRRPNDQTLWRFALVLMLLLMVLQFCQTQTGLDWRDAF
jgi:hypothetical protein